MNNQSHVWENPKGKGITLGRRISRILSPCACYNPSRKTLKKAEYTRAATGTVEDGTFKNKIDVPVLDRAWSYFEHQILPRRFKGDDGYFVLAPPGDDERETQLFPIWGTTMEELGDFGDGVGLYFYTLRYFSIVTVIVGIVHIPIMWYYASNEYAEKEKEPVQFHRIVLKWILKGSAVCTNTSWEPCPTCAPDDWTDFPSTNDRLAYAYTNATSIVNNTISVCTSNQWDTFSPAKLIFIKKNNCDLHDKFGVLSLASIGLVLVAVYYFIFAHNKKAIDFDDGKQTSSDYSIVIMNPPKDTADPELWKDFFESNFEDVHVAACTIAVNNESLIKLLVRRRKLLLRLQDMLPAEELYDEHDLEKSAGKCAPVPTWKKWLYFTPDAKEILNAIYKEDRLIRKQSKKEYNASKVFITFETQYAQRKVLKEMSPPILRKGANRDVLRFEGTVLEVLQPTEPCDIRWGDLSDSPFIQFSQRLMTAVVSLVLIAGGSCFIRYAREENEFLAPFTITIINILSPTMVSKLTSFESHPTETSYSTSRYLKLTIFRWLFTAVLTTIITPFTDTIQDEASLINSISILFMLDLIRFPLLQLPDIIGNLRRHVFGPRAGSQRQMNLYFQGTDYDIGERYTEVTRILFLTFFYGTIFPAAFFFAYVILTMMYCLDKYSLLRIWKQGPKIGAYISTFSTNLFLVIALTYTLMASYYYAHFPFDNACDTGERVPSKYIGAYCAQMENVDVDFFSILTTTDHTTHMFCDQQINHRTFIPLPYLQPEGSKSMTDSQESFSKLYGWTCVGVVLLIGLTLFLRVAINFFNTLICRGYQSSGAVMDEKFSDIPERMGYVPKVDIPGYCFPFLLCNIDNIDENLVGWRDPEKSDDFNNLIFDVPTVANYVTMTRKREAGPKLLHIKDTLENVEISLNKEVVLDEPKVFSKVKEWPTVGKRKLIHI